VQKKIYEVAKIFKLNNPAMYAFHPTKKVCEICRGNVLFIEKDEIKN
jgi:uncharacterized protein with PIN domain